MPDFSLWGDIGFLYSKHTQGGLIMIFEGGIV
jgi:hypothetical protein